MTPVIPETTRATVLRDVANGMKVKTIRIPRPKAGEVLVRTPAHGVCRPDLHIISGAIAFPIPCVLGHEAAGEVVEIKSHNEHSGLATGDRVAGGFLMPCGQYESHAADRDDLYEPFFSLNRLRGRLYDSTIRSFDLDGNPTQMYSMGGLAEYCIIPSTSIVKLPGGADPVTRAILGCAAITACGAMRRDVDLRYSETAAVVVTGGVGSNVIQIAKAFRARWTVTIDVADDKLTAAVELGAADTVNPAKVNAREAVMGLMDGRGVDVAFGVLGRPQTWPTALDVLRDGGRTVPVGLGAEVQRTEAETSRMVCKSWSIVGSYGTRTRRDLPKVAWVVAAGVINYRRIVSHRCGLDGIAVGYQQLHNGQITDRTMVGMSL